MSKHKELAGRLRVKPMEWTKHPERDAWRVDTMLGTYKVFAIVSPVSWTFDGGIGSTRIDQFAATPDAAKAAAQADYERRILSAIDADALDSLSPPDGVGLTRWEFWTTHGGDLDYGVQEDGPWVRYEDANAALAAEKARADKIEGNLDDGTYLHRSAVTEWKARCDTLAGALDEAADDMRRIISNIDHDIGIQLVRLDLKAAMNRAQAALATIPAKPETQP